MIAQNVENLRKNMVYMLVSSFRMKVTGFICSLLVYAVCKIKLKTDVEKGRSRRVLFSVVLLSRSGCYRQSYVLPETKEISAIDVDLQIWLVRTQRLNKIIHCFSVDEPRGFG